MSSVARLHPLPRTARSPYAGCDYLGPAAVTDAQGASLQLELADGRRVDAQPALALSYQPAAGDTVVAIRNGQACYVIGVLACRGKGVLTFPGDLDVQAGGTLRLRGDEGVELEGPVMDVRVGKLSVVARAVTERFRSLRQSVAELLSVQAGKTHTVVDGSSYTAADSATLLTKNKVSINGKAIHLG